MNITINKPRLTVLALLIIAANLSVLFFGPPNVGRVKPEHPGLILITDSALIFIGVAVQVWTRDKPQFRPLKLFAYFATLLMCGALCFGLLATALGRFF